MLRPLDGRCSRSITGAGAKGTVPVVELVETAPDPLQSQQAPEVPGRQGSFAFQPASGP